jgi:hypothetical protein
VTQFEITPAPHIGASVSCNTNMAKIFDSFMLKYPVSNNAICSDQLPERTHESIADYSRSRINFYINAGLVADWTKN